LVGAAFAPKTIAEGVMDERDQLPWNAERVEWGLAPPYGAYRGRYSSYQLAQYGSMGSGRLGGWSSVKLGGSFDDTREQNPDLDR
jgi:hypothetical protein